MENSVGITRLSDAGQLSRVTEFSVRIEQPQWIFFLGCIPFLRQLHLGLNHALFCQFSPKMSTLFASATDCMPSHCGRPRATASVVVANVRKCPGLCLCVSSVLLAFWSPCLGKRELVFVLIVHLFVSYAHVNLCHVFSSSSYRGLAAASACGSSWTFLFTFFLSFKPGNREKDPSPWDEMLQETYKDHLTNEEVRNTEFRMQLECMMIS